MYKKTIEEVVNSLDTNIDKGLTSSEAKKRQGIYGTNELEKPQKRSLLLRFLDQFKDAMIIILIIAAVVSIIVEPGEWIDSLIIVIVVIHNEELLSCFLRRILTVFCVQIVTEFCKKCYKFQKTVLNRNSVLL